MVRPGEVVMFLLELAAYVGVAWWAYHLREGSWIGVLYALAAIAVMGLVWGLLCAPNAPFQVTGPARIALEVVWFGIGALAYALSGVIWAGIVLAVAFLATLALRLRGAQA